jgi:sec-independent protein translocase protein TatC
MAFLYFGAVTFALINDKRKGRNRPYADLPDDVISPLDDLDNGDPITAGSGRYVPEPVERPQPLDQRYDDFT